MTEIPLSRLLSRILLRDPAIWAWTIAILLGLSFWWIAPLIYTNDTPGYIRDARALLGRGPGGYSYWRTPGFPLLLLVTGTALGWTSHLLVFVQLLMGVLMPILIYYSLSWINRWVALSASALCSLSLVPFINTAYVMPNQLFFFTVVVATYVASRYLATRETKYLYYLALACFATVFARPQGSFLFVAFFAALLPFHRKQFLHWTAAVLTMLALQFAYTVTRPYFVHPISQDPVVLMPYGEGENLLPGDDLLYRRAMVMVRENLYANALFFERLINDDERRARLRLAVVTQHLLNKDIRSAHNLALQATDASVRDRALALVIEEYWRRGNEGFAKKVFESIKDPAVRKMLSSHWGRPESLRVPYERIPADEKAAPRRYVSGFDLTNTTGKMLLFQIFTARSNFPDAIVIPQNGPATTQLAMLMEAYLASFPERFPGYPELTSLPPREAVLYMLTGDLSIPYQFQFHWTIWIMLDSILGPERGDILLKRVYLEFVALHPREIATMYLDNSLAGLTLRNLYHFRGNAPGFLPTHPRIETRPRIAREITRSERNLPSYLKLNQLYMDYYPLLHRVLLGLAAIGLVTCLMAGTHRHFRFLLLAWLVALHQIAVCAVTAGVGFNYTSISCIYITIAAAVGTYAAYARWFARNQERIPIQAP